MKTQDGSEDVVIGPHPAGELSLPSVIEGELDPVLEEAKGVSHIEAILVKAPVIGFEHDFILNIGSVTHLFVFKLMKEGCPVSIAKTPHVGEDSEFKTLPVLDLNRLPWGYENNIQKGSILPILTHFLFEAVLGRYFKPFEKGITKSNGGVKKKVLGGIIF